MARIPLVLAVLLVSANSLFAFSITFPDSPVVITELDPTGTNYDFGRARVLERDSHDYLYAVYPQATGIYISRSTDNGFTWSVFARPAIKRDDQDQFHAPCIAIDSGDSIYVTWEGYHYLLGYNLYYNKFNGKVWMGETKIDRDSGITTNTLFLSALAVERNNIPHVVWEGWKSDPSGNPADTLWHNYMSPKGEWAWPPEEVGKPPGCWIPSLMSDSAGNLHLGFGWDSPPSGLPQAQYRKRQRDGTWLPIEDIRCVRSLTDTVSGSPALTVIPGDTIPRATVAVVSLNPSYRAMLYYRFRQDSGWSYPQLILPNQDYAWFQFDGITADRQGHLYVIWSLQQTYRGGNVVAQNIWMREQQYPPLWNQPFKVTNDTMPLGARSGAINSYCILGYPVTENGVELTWVKTAWDSLTGQHYYLMYDRLPSLLGVEQEKGKIPPREPEVTLSPRPNPARGEIEIDYGIPKTGNGKTEEMVNLTIYNLMGEKVRTLAYGPAPAGVYRVRWNGKDERLRDAPSGTYFFQLTVGEKQVIKKGTFIR